MLEKLFGFDSRKTSVGTEIIAGLTTFLTMAYVLALIPSTLAKTGMDQGAVFTTIIIATVFSTLLMAFYAKLPFALAPSVGLNAFFVYTVCMAMDYTWQFALTAVFLEGLVFIFLTVTHLRQKIVDLLPDVIKKSMGVGIGLFITFIGLQNAGIVVDNPATLVSLGNVTSGSGLLGMIGLLLTAILLAFKVRGAMLISMVLITIIGIPMGVTHFDGIFSAPPSIEPVMGQFVWDQIFSKDMLIIVFTFLFVDMFDTIGTIVGVSVKAGMVDKDGKIPHLGKAFLVDAIGTTVGAFLGSSTITTFVESTSGISAGGRSGLTAFVTAMCFVLALFLSPFFLCVPAAATGPILAIVGLMMLSLITKINFDDYTESVPAFICMIFMPMAFSISDGIVLGLLSYVFINLLTGNFKKMSVGTYILAILFLYKYLM